MTKTELLEILSNGENSGVEFKKDDLVPEKLARELVAFSNFEGGMLLLGVEDDGRVTGLIRNNLEEWVMNVCREKIRPAIIPYFEIVPDVKDKKNVAVIRVKRGYDVHALWHNDARKYLIRVGSQSRDASNEELARLFQRRGSIRAELQPVSGTAFENLDLRRLRDYFSNLRQQNVPVDEDSETWKSLLVNTEIMVEESVSVGGMLMFGLMPNRFLPHAGIDAVAYAGSEQDYDAIERTKLRSPMTPILDQAGNILENGLVEQALSFVKRNTAVVWKKDGGRRLERPIYPDDVLREVIVNALIHRDYLLTSSDVVLAVYDDRLEIISPGHLPNGITPERMRLGVRATRNELLKDVMRDYRYLEHMGMGISRKVIRGMQEHNNTEPELIELDERFLVRIFA